MSDTGFQDDPQDQDEVQSEGESHNMRQLREQAKAGREAQAALAAANRQIAVLQSGIDVESPVGELFLKAYDGEVTAEAMKEAAAKYGVPIKGQEPAPAEEPTEEPESTEPTGTAERRALSDGAPADTGEDEDPRKTSIDRFNELMAQGLPYDEAAGESIAILAQAAHRGDKRVIYEPQRGT